MTLWNIIRDWFVINIFGGYASSGVYYTQNIIGQNMTYADGQYDDSYISFTNDIYLNIGSKVGDSDIWLSMADWLSTTATIIVLCAMCFFLFLVVRWLFRLTSGLLSGRG